MKNNLLDDSKSYDQVQNALNKNGRKFSEQRNNKFGP